MLSLVYVSSACSLFTGGKLIALLAQSREKNARLGITGLLLYKDGNFIQVLEGPDDAVRELFAVIQSDFRHRGVLKLLERPIDERQFPDWAMGFRDLDDPTVRALPGFSDFLDTGLTPETFRDNPGQARRLLEVFRKNM